MHLIASKQPLVLAHIELLLDLKNMNKITHHTAPYKTIIRKRVVNGCYFNMLRWRWP